MREDSLSRIQFRRLIKHFFGRFFDTETFSTPHADMHLLLVQILALLVMPGELKIVLSAFKYGRLAVLPAAFRNQEVILDEYFFLCFSMILTGLVTVFEWDALFPDQKDYYNLIPLPIRPGTILFAKMIALSLFIVLFNIAINGLPAVMFPGIILVPSKIPGSAGYAISAHEAVMYYVGHATAVFLGSLFVFAVLIAVHALFHLALPAKLVRTVSRYMQLGLILILVCALFSNVDAARQIMDGSFLIYILPPFWFLGLYEVLIGDQSVIFVALAKLSCAALAVAGAVAILSYILSYRSSMQKGFQSAGLAYYPVSCFRKWGNWVLHRTILRGSVERATYHFIGQTLFRRQDHMLYWGSFIAAGIAVIYFECDAIRNGSRMEWSQYPLVLPSFPLILSFFLLFGLRHVFSVPADLNANWIFKATDNRMLAGASGGVHKFMMCAMAAPVFLIVVPCYWLGCDFGRVLLQLTFVSILSLIFIKLLLLGSIKLPFTCSYIPGKAKIILRWPAYVLACLLYAFGMVSLELWTLQDTKAYITFILTAGLIIVGLNRYRSSFLKGINAIQFEEEPEEVVNVLTIE